MKIQTADGVDIYIADDSVAAKKIMQGHTFTVNNGKIAIGAKTGFDMESFVAKLQGGKATVKDINEYLLTQIANGNS